MSYEALFQKGSLFFTKIEVTFGLPLIYLISKTMQMFTDLAYLPDMTVYEKLDNIA